MVRLQQRVWWRAHIVVGVYRYYARGLFAANLMVAPGDSAVAKALGAPLPVLDWPLRRASGGVLAAGDFCSARALPEGQQRNASHVGLVVHILGKNPQTLTTVER